MPQKTAKDSVNQVLEEIATGKIVLPGHKKGDIKGLAGQVLILSAAQDSTLYKGNTLPFGDNGQAKVMAIGTELNGLGQVEYHIQLTYPTDSNR